METAYNWSLATLEELGLDDPHLEAIEMDPFQWQQLTTSVTLVHPDSMVMVAQAGTWSVATPGNIQREAIAVEIKSSSDFDRYRGTLSGKIVLLGPLRDTPLMDKALAIRYSDETVLSGEPNKAVRESYRTASERRPGKVEEGLFRAELRRFLEEEKVAAVLVPSEDGARGGGSGNLRIEEGPFSVRSWRLDERPQFPFAYLAIEHFGRAWRLASSGQAVAMEVFIEVDENLESQPVYNVVADFKGSDPMVKDEVVLAGAHLDSWASGTGALDNASGVAMVLEAVRLLKDAGFTPRRTIRVVLFGAEEQGLFGSHNYARWHLGHFPRSDTSEELALSAEARRKVIGPLQVEPAHKDFSIMYNMDGGAGRIRGVYTGGNPALAAIFEEWIEPLKELGLLAVYDEPFWPADQSVFSDIGLPAVMFLQDPLEYFSRARHSNLDTVERIQPESIVQAATILSVFLAQSANAPEKMPRPD